MICRKPFVGRGKTPFGCGQCLPCRINRRRQWTLRQVLESYSHKENCFVTLTYSDDHLPEGGSLKPRDLQLFLKRLRETIYPDRCRYFAVGEYGDESFRPHYHLSLFGLCWTSLVARSTKVHRDGSFDLAVWGLGRVTAYEFNEETAQYVCGYVTKKMTGVDDVRLQGRLPEFARMSRRPGIGSDAMAVVAATLGSTNVLDQLEGGDVPRSLRVGRRTFNLGRFLLKRLREHAGFQPEYIETLKAKAVYDRSLEVSAVLADKIASAPLSPSTTKTIYTEEVKQKILQVESRNRVYRKRVTL